MHVLCNGDKYRPLKLEIFDWDSNGKHDTMGHVRLCYYSTLLHSIDITGIIVYLCFGGGIYYENFSLVLFYNSSLLFSLSVLSVYN